jgi:serine/threonine-protein kinase
MTSAPSGGQGCPSEETLDRYVDRDLGPPVSGTIAEHIDRCARCRAIVERLVPAFGARGSGNEQPSEGLPSLEGHEEWLREAAQLPEDLEPGPPPFQEGEILADKYRLGPVLGRGGMGVVIAGTHVHLKQRVAIKLLRAKGRPGSEAVKRFLREAQAAASIESPHVVRVLDMGTRDDGVPYMVMEFLEGNDLAEILSRRRRLSTGEAVGYVLQACEGIAEAHARGILHRDIKPSNLFLADRSGGRKVVKVLDFGVSKLASPAAAVLTLTDSAGLLGSPAYMSPEQMMTAKSVDVRTDVWSLGVTLFELVAGRPPFSGDSLPEIIASVLSTPAPSIASHGEDVSPEFAAVLARSLEKDRSRRYRDVAELAAAIAPFGPGSALASVERIREILVEAPPLPEALDTSGKGGGDLVPAHAAISGGAGRSTEYPVSHDRLPEVPARGAASGSRSIFLAGALGAILIAGWIGSGGPFEARTSVPERTQTPSSASIEEDPSVLALPSVESADAAADTEALADRPDATAPDAGENRKRKKPAPPAISTTASASAVDPRCVPSFVIDANGHRKYKPECL